MFLEHLRNKLIAPLRIELLYESFRPICSVDFNVLLKASILCVLVSMVKCMIGRAGFPALHFHTPSEGHLRWVYPVTGNYPQRGRIYHFWVREGGPPVGEVND